MLLDRSTDDFGRSSEQEQLQRLSIAARGRRHRIDFGSMKVESIGWERRLYRRLYRRAVETFQRFEKLFESSEIQS